MLSKIHEYLTRHTEWFLENFVVEEGGATYPRNKSGRKQGRKPLQVTELMLTLSKIDTSFADLSVQEQNGVVQALKEAAIPNTPDRPIMEEVDEWVVPLLLSFRWFSDKQVVKMFYFQAWAQEIAEGRIPEEDGLHLRRELTMVSGADDCLATVLQSDPKIWTALSDAYAEACGCKDVRVTPKSRGDKGTVYHCFRSYLILMQKLWLSDGRFALPEEPRQITNQLGRWAFWYFDPKRIPREAAPTPAWDGWMAKLGHEDNRKVFRAWLFSVFIARNQGRQLLWLHDNGGGGKSTIARVLQWYMGHKGCGAISAHLTDSEFGAASAYGKRLLVHPDNKNPRLLSSALVHQIVAGDYVQINDKFQKAFTAFVYCKVMVMANCPPDTDTYNLHERSRLIYLHLDPDAPGADRSHRIVSANGKVQLKGDPQFEDRLKAEFESLLCKAKYDYLELCPNHGNIILPDSMVENTDTACSSVEQDSFETLYLDNFEKKEGKCMLTSVVKEVFDDTFKGPQKSMQYQSFLKYVAEVHGHVKCRHIDKNGSKRRVLYGMVPKGTIGEEYNGNKQDGDYDA